MSIDTWGWTPWGLAWPAGSTWPPGRSASAPGSTSPSAPTACRSSPWGSRTWRPGQCPSGSPRTGPTACIVRRVNKCRFAKLIYQNMNTVDTKSNFLNWSWKSSWLIKFLPCKLIQHKYTVSCKDIAQKYPQAQNSSLLNIKYVDLVFPFLCENFWEYTVSAAI